MKAASSLLILIATIGLARAGSFQPAALAMAGPPPFTNESPLLSGMDGTYQAVASGVNLTGVFSFVISGGIQTSDQSATINGWVFFVDGNIFQGSVVAAISQTTVAGVLNGGTTHVTVRKRWHSDSPFRICHSWQHSVWRLSWPYFVHSPDGGAFGGDGILQGTPGRLISSVFINQPFDCIV